MSKNYYQKTYNCDCLLDPWGSTCGNVSKFLLVENASIDTNTLYHKTHGSEWHLYQPGKSISDPEIGALQDLLNKKELDEKIDPINL